MRAYDELARYYDLAFSQDLGWEADWHAGVFGAGCRRVLEPACGSARWLEAFARRGLQCTGIDLSPTMLARGRARLEAAGVEGVELVEADMTDFDLGRRFDAALCPVNSFTYLLTIEAAAAHLECMARHLEPGAPYLMQVDLVDTARHEPGPADQFSDWEVEAEGLRLRATVSATGWDPATCVEGELMRFELLEGEGEGTVLEDRQQMRLWSWETWSALLAGSDFEQVAAHDGRWRSKRERLEVGPELEGVRLCIHELRRR